MTAAFLFSFAIVVLGVMQIEIAKQADSAGPADRLRFDIAEQFCTALIICCAASIAWSVR